MENHVPPYRSQIEGDDVIELSVAQRDVQLIFGDSTACRGCLPGASDPCAGENIELAPTSFFLRSFGDCRRVPQTNPRLRSGFVGITVTDCARTYRSG